MSHQCPTRSRTQGGGSTRETESGFILASMPATLNPAHWILQPQIPPFQQPPPILKEKKGIYKFRCVNASVGKEELGRPCGRSRAARQGGPGVKFTETSRELGEDQE